MKNIHKKINFFDPQINVKKKLVNEKFQYLPGTKIPLPSEVEISESGTCNRKCSFCPRSDPNYVDIKEFIKRLVRTRPPVRPTPTMKLRDKSSREELLRNLKKLLDDGLIEKEEYGRSYQLGVNVKFY